MKKRRKKHTEMRQKIIAAATDIISRKGFAALSTRGLALKVGVSVGTIYNYFRDSHELMFLLNTETINLLSEALAPLATQPDVAAHHLIDVYFSFIESEGNRWRMLFEYFPPPGHRIPVAYTEAIERAVLAASAALAPALQSKDQQQRRDIAIGSWSMLHGLSILDRQGKLGRITGGQSLRHIALSTMNATLGINTVSEVE